MAVIDREKQSLPHRAIRLQPNIGAEIEGIDLTGPLTPELRDTILDLVFQHQVIFFLDQKLDPETQTAFGKLFGELVTDSIAAYRGETKELGVLKTGSYYGTPWHSDASYREDPYFLSILRSVVAPELGGDTVWASATAAYRALPDEVKERIANLDAFHSPFSKAVDILQGEELEAYMKASPGTKHPVVTSHPYTSEPVLYVNSAFTQRIVGLPDDESAELLGILLAQFNRPENQVRFKWRPGSVAIWDNRAVQHYGVADYGDAERHLERVVVGGDRPRRA